MKLNKYELVLVKEKEFEYDGAIATSDDAANIAQIIGYETYPEERLGMFCLDAKGHIVGYHEISHGGLCSSEAHPREIFKRAITANAACIILVHNHVSGLLIPSDDDIETTKRIKEAGNLLGIPLVDHIIIGHQGYCSLKREEYL